MKVQHIILLISFVLCASVAAMAQTVRATSSAEDVFAKQVFEISYTVENGGNASFTPPDFKPFELSAGPFKTSQLRIINGRRSDSKTYTYRLRIDKVGTFEIPAASIKTSTLTRKSNKLKIRVLEPTKENMMQGNNLYLDMKLNDSTIYVGQQLLIDHSIYYGSLDVRGSALVGDFPRDRFIVKQVQNGTNIRKSQVEYQGKIQNKAAISRLSLFPLRSGPMEVPDINFEISIQNPNAPKRRGFFSFNSYDSKLVRTPEFNLDILPLPVDAPENFTGCVGTLAGGGRIDKRALKVGEEVFVAFQLKGNGLADLVSAPEWKQDGFQIYDAKLISEDVQIQNGEIVFVKNFQYLLIPEEEGRKQLSIPYAYFDPIEERYVTSSTNLGTFTVSASGTVLQDATDKTMDQVGETNSKPDYTFAILGGVGVLVLGGLALMFLRKKKEEEEEITPEEASRIIAQRKLSAAKDLLDRKETGKYFETLENALRIYLEEKLDVNTSQYSIAAIEQNWLSRNYAAEKLAVWMEMGNKINLARYAGQDIANMENLYKEALDWIIDVEKAYPSEEVV